MSKNKAKWDALDEEAARQGNALRDAFRSPSVPTVLMRGIFSTHKGHGQGAVAPPSGSKLRVERTELVAQD